MSIIDDLLILTDNLNSITLSEIGDNLPNQSKQIIASALGRLTSKKLIDKKISQNNTSFIITKSGRDKINSTLNSVKLYSDKRNDNHSWQFVIFDIPEKNRSSRDAFRNYLISLGFGKLQDSIWVSSHNYYDDIHKTIKILNIQNLVTVISTANLSNIQEQELIDKTNWNWKDINNSYQEYIKESNKFLTNKNKTSYNARRLVFKFAKTLTRDPKLPEYLQPKKTLTGEAFNIYQKIRSFCY
ncbi:MAG: Repressor in the phenylacetic acid catabolism [uncultured bacterium]|nr:MAG: Repressor in the phenylacetic acid catabolism [uncultured bacterium]